jgi:HlyD family secretion protein
MKRMRMAVVLLLMVFCVSCNSQSDKEKAVSITQEDQAQSVDVDGFIKAKEKRDIIIEFPATVEEIFVTEGQVVSKGEKLIELNTSDYNLQIAYKEQELAIAESDLEKLINLKSSGEAALNRLKKELEAKENRLRGNTDPDIRKAILDVESAENTYLNAAEDLKNKESLYESGSISQSELKEFKEQVELKKKAVQDAKWTLESLKNKLNEEIDQLKTAVEQQQAQVGPGGYQTDIENQKKKIEMLEEDVKALKGKLSKSFLDNNCIVSEFQHCLIFEIDCVEGNIISSGQKALSIIDMDSLIVMADVSEDFIKDVKVGAPAAIVPQADRSRNYTGKVLAISGKTATKSGDTVVPVEISIDNRDEFLIPEFNVDVEIVIQENSANN